MTRTVRNPASDQKIGYPVIDYRRDINCLWFPPAIGAGGAETPAPLLLFLHGIGERGQGGEDLARVNDWGVTKYRAHNTSIMNRPFPFLLVAPQCPADRQWSEPDMLDSLQCLIDTLVRSGVADPDRLYLTGFSMGGIGAFSLALRMPQRFAAVAPICGRCLEPSQLPSLARLPIWLAYAEDDEVTELALGSRDAAERLAPFGCLEVHRFRLGAGGGQGAHVRTCDAAYADPRLYDWLLSHRKGAC